MKLSKGQKIQRAMDRLLDPKPKSDNGGKKGDGNMNTTLPRKGKFWNHNQPPANVG